MQVAVIGAGVVGVSTAYFLAKNGHQVVVIEHSGNVCEEASSGHAGLLGPAHLAPLAGPGMAKQVLSQWLKSDSAVHLRPALQLAQWRWLRSWLKECNAEQLLLNKKNLQRLASYSQLLLNDISQTHQLDFQQRQGILQLFRHAKEQTKISAGLAVLNEAEIAFQLLDAAACYQIEPAINPHQPLAGGLFLPQDSSGNCALYTKQLKRVAQQLGVEFEFLTTCEQVLPTKYGVTLHLKQAHQSKQQQVDAVVLAAGANSMPLLKNLGIDLRLAQFQTYCNTASIKNPEDSPFLSIIDESEQVAITRMDKRIRVAGTIHFQKRAQRADARYWQRLRNVASEWFPNAANYHSAHHWSCQHLMMPNGLPIVGQSPLNSIYVNLAHAENGWALATGSGKIIADLISGQEPEINLDGFSIMR